MCLMKKSVCCGCDGVVLCWGRWSYAPFTVRSHFAWSGWAMREYVGVWGRKIRRGVFEGVPTNDVAPPSITADRG